MPAIILITSTRAAHSGHAFIEDRLTHQCFWGVRRVYGTLVADTLRVDPLTEDPPQMPANNAPPNATAAERSTDTPVQSLIARRKAQQRAPPSHFRQATR